MPGPVVYEFRVEGNIDPHWSDWFAGLSVTHQPGGVTVLRGPLSDQAAMHGVLMKIRDLRLVLISVSRLEAEAPGD